MSLFDSAQHWGILPKVALGENRVSDKRLREETSQNSARQPQPLKPESKATSEPLKLNQYINFDVECSGIFSEQDVQGAKQLMKDR
jgi:hypothetical protein